MYRDSHSKVRLCKKSRRRKAEQFTVDFQARSSSCAARVRAVPSACEIFQNLYNFEHYNFFNLIKNIFSAIEAWVIVCVLFVFGALIEYAGLLLKIKIGTTRGQNARVPKKSPTVGRENSLALNANGNVEDRKTTLRGMSRKKQREDMSHARLDILFLLLFPLFFLIFNVIYWVSFLYTGQHCHNCTE